MLGRRLQQDRGSRRKDDPFEHVELVDPSADDPPEMLREKYLVLNVGTAFISAITEGRKGKVEVVVTEVAAEGQQVSVAQSTEIAHFHVEGPVLE